MNKKCSNYNTNRIKNQIFNIPFTIIITTSITVFFYEQYQERKLVSEKYSCKSIYKYAYKVIFVYHNLLKKFSIIVLLYKCPLGLGCINSVNRFSFHNCYFLFSLIYLLSVVIIGLPSTVKRASLISLMPKTTSFITDNSSSVRVRLNNKISP